MVPIKTNAGASDHQIIEGDVASEEVLKQADIKHAHMVIAARQDDSENAFSCVSPTSQTVSPGKFATCTLTLTPINGFTEP